MEIFDNILQQIDKARNNRSISLDKVKNKGHIISYKKGNNHLILSSSYSISDPHK